MYNQPDHVPSPHVLPPSPFGPAQASSHHTDNQVDLTIDESQSQSQKESPVPIFQDELLPCRATPRLRQSPANAERRSATGHPPRKQSDATRAPNPANGYQGPPMTKPGADKAFRPTNTLGGSTAGLAINPAYGSKHVRTYGKQGRNHKSNSWDQLPGRQGYLDRQNQRSSISHGDRVSQPSPAKRRKTEHHVTEPMQTVELSDSGEEEPQQRPPAPRQASTPRAHSYVSSQSPHSATSKRSEAESKRRGLPKSEFTTTSDLLAAKRTRPRHKYSNESDKDPTSLFNGSPVLAGSLSQGRHAEETSSIEPLEYHSIERAERGVVHKPEGHHLSDRLPEKVTSKFFQQDSKGPRINESTAENTSNEASITLRTYKNLREYQSARSHMFKTKVDKVESSGDELGQSEPPESKPKQTHTKSTQRGKAAPRSKRDVGQEYRLSYALTYTTEPGSKNLLLSQNDPSNHTHYRISGTDVNGKEKTLHQLNLHSATKAIADDGHCIRLTGGIPVDGNRFWYDLSFEDSNEFKHFRDRVVFSQLAPSCCLIKSSDYLKLVFSKPLQANNKIDQSAVQGEILEPTQAPVEQQSEPRLSSLRARMTNARNASGSVISDHDSLRDPATRTRPLRNTRSTVPAYPALDDEKEVEKYSQTGKLGKTWPNHLDFSIQESFLKRRRCTVNFDDLPKLDEEEFLNDSLVNFYLLYLYNQLKVSIDRVYFFNTYFFDTLTKNTKKGEAINYDAVKSWTKRDDVFSYDHIVVPINEKFHWYLAIICNISNIPRKHAAEQYGEVTRDPSENATDPATLASTASNIAIGVERQSVSQSATPAPEPLISKDFEDEENLFEEEKKLSLINPDEEDVGGKQPSTDGQTLFDGQAEHEADTEAAATVAVQSVQLEDHAADSVPIKPRQFAKKKKQAGPKKDPEKPVIAVLDSLGSMHSNATRALREWLEAEGLEKRNMIVEIDNKGYYPKSAHIPMQNNFSDCGLYVLGYAKKFFADPDGFKDKLLKAEMSSATDWPDMDASKMRKDIRDLLLQLYKDQECAKKEARRAKAAAKAKSAPPSPTNAESTEIATAEQQANIVRTETSPLTPHAADSEPKPATAPNERATSPETTNRSRTDKEQPREASDVDVTATATPLHAELPQKTSSTPKPTLPNGSPAKRHKSPEVRVSHNSPFVDKSLYERFDGAIDRSQQSPRRTTDRSSPSRKLGLHTISGEEARPSSKDKVKTKSRSPREGPSPSSLSQSRTRSGSHDDPIPLEDSQDLDAPLQRPTRSPKPSAKKVIELDRSQETVITPHQRSSPAKRKGTHIRFHDDSIQEVFSQDWQEGRDISRAMKASMQDQQARHSAQARDADDNYLDTWAGSFDHPVAPSESSHTMEQISETQPMDIDDAEIPESPQQRRSSPVVAVEEMEWQSRV